MFRWFIVLWKYFIADLVFTGTAQVICRSRDWTRRVWFGHFFRHGGYVHWAPQKLIKATVGTVIRNRFQAEQIWRGMEKDLWEVLNNELQFKLSWQVCHVHVGLGYLLP